MLTDQSTTITEERSSKKNPLSEAEARQLLGRVKTVRIAKGKTVLTQPAGATDPDDLRGPTGNFRAPMIVKGDTLLVGFHEEALKALL